VQGLDSFLEVEIQRAAIAADALWLSPWRCDVEKGPACVATQAAQKPLERLDDWTEILRL
jgi:hypothetical protein